MHVENSVIPNISPEDMDSYGSGFTIDQGGVDVIHFGETISASFEGQDRLLIAADVVDPDENSLTVAQVHWCMRMIPMSATNRIHNSEDVGILATHFLNMYRRELEREQNNA